MTKPRKQYVMLCKLTVCGTSWM